MIVKDETQISVSDAPPPTSAEAETRAAQILVELDSIVGKSRWRLRRAFTGVGNAFAAWLDRLVPPAPPTQDTETPPQIRFPFF